MDERSIKLVSEFLSMSAHAFDMVRIIDPANKQVRYFSVVYESGLKLGIEEVGSDEKCCDEKCYEIWGREKSCENCSSARAEISNRITVREEIKDDEVYQIVSLPFKTDNEHLVLTLISILPQNSDYLNESRDLAKIKKVIENNNLRAVIDLEYNVYNHNYAVEQLNSIINFSKRNGKSFIIVCFEIEVYNDYNYEVSHQHMTDMKQKLVGHFKAMPFDGESWIARVGSERFLMYFNSDDDEKIVNLLLHVKKEIPKFIRYEDTKFSSIVSLGITKFSSDAVLNYDFVINASVGTLEKAKKKFFRKMHVSRR